jgi:hypothetical protein
MDIETPEICRISFPPKPRARQSLGATIAIDDAPVVRRAGARPLAEPLARSPSRAGAALESAAPQHLVPECPPRTTLVPADGPLVALRFSRLFRRMREAP